MSFIQAWRKPILFLFSLCLSTYIFSQTLLEQGDLAVIGVNANNRDCGGEIGEDLVSFVCFKDILPGTTIDITDNGWERENANSWGNSEAFFRMERTGATIPAGTIITLRLPGVGGTYSAAAPDNDWTFTPLNTLANNVNLNSGGDQIFFLQGGNWFDGTSSGFLGFSHDGFYDNGRILFGFNSTTSWDAFAMDSQDSGLPAEISNCFNMAPTSSATDFFSYQGPLDPAPQLEWVSRISDPSNWQSFADCASYINPPTSIGIAASGISISCRVCQSCGPTEEIMLFNLPDVGGPFIVQYRIGQDTFISNGIENQDSLLVPLDTTTSFEIISVSDVNGCPAFSSFDGGFTTLIDTIPLINRVNPLQSCPDENGEGNFNLRSLDSLLAGQNNPTINWFLDVAGVNTLSQAESFNSLSTSVFAVVLDDNCVSPIQRVELQVNEPPNYNFIFEGSECDTICRDLNFEFSGTPPFALVYRYSFEDVNQRDTLFSNNTSGLLEVCSSNFPANSAGVELILLELLDANCSLLLDRSLPVYNGGPVVSNYNQTLCEDERLIINDNVYDQRQPVGTEVLAGAAANGCDSIVNIALVFNLPVIGELSGPASICPGETANLSFDLQGADFYTIELQIGNASPIRLNNVQDGDQYPISPTVTTIYSLISVNADGIDCADQLASSITVEVNQSDVNINPTTDFGGFPISCADASDGGLIASVSGNLGPYQLLWNTGDSSQAINNLRAGTYTLQVRDRDGCQTEEEFTLLAPDPLALELQLDPAACDGQTGRLVIVDIEGGTAPFEYSLDGIFFQPIPSLPFANNDIEPNSYRLSVQDVNDCRIAQDIFLGNPDGLSIDLGADESIVAGDSLIIKAEPSFTPASVEWTNAEDATFLNALEIRVRPSVTTTYAIRVESADGCSVSATKTVFVEQNQAYYAPSGFSPNEDGFNDRFTLYGGTNVRQFNFLRIFNRWGQLVYEVEALQPNDEFQGWNGEINDALAPNGVYLYTAEMVLSSGKTEIVMGDFLLIR